MADDDGTHPSWSDLDAVRTGDGTPDHSRHADACRTCQETLLRLQQLSTDIGAVIAPSLEVPADIEARILWKARKRAQIARQSSAPKRTRFIGRRWAVAAVLVLALGAVDIWRRSGVSPVQPHRVATVATSDIDGNGKVDIRDAFVLAKAIESSSDALADEIEAAGLLDSDDVDRIARRAVALGKPG